jgi:hypothetical protein
MTTESPLTAASMLTGDHAPAADTSGSAPTAPGAATPGAGQGVTTETPKADDTPVVKLPGKDATPEQWAEFYKSIGAPDKADAYELPVPEGDDGSFAKIAAEWFKDAGLLPQQAKALADKWNEFSAAQQQAMQQAEQQRIQQMDAKNRAEQEALKTEWGQQHDANLELARRAARQFFPRDNVADVVTALEGVLGYGQTIKLLHSIGKGLAEHDAPGLGQQTQSRKSLAEILYGGSMPA